MNSSAPAPARAQTQARAQARVNNDEIVIRIPCPAPDGSTDNLAGLIGFAARADGYQGLVLWLQYQAMHTVLQAKLDAIPSGRERDACTSIFDPVCQTAASYAVVAGVRQFTAERFVDRSISCMARVPAIGLLLRDGVLSPYQFHGALVQVALVDDGPVLEEIDVEAARRLRAGGALSLSRVTSIVSAVVAKLDPDGAKRTRDAAKTGKRVVANPVDSELTELIVTADSADVALSMKVLDTLISGVCAHDPRSKQVRRADAAMNRINGTPFECRCGRDDCTSELTDADAAARAASIVLHVVVRRESLTGDSDDPGFLDGHGPVSAAQLREMATRPDAIVRDLDLDELIDRTAQDADPHRPTTTCDVAVRGLFGQCSWPGCDRPAFESDLDHVCEFNHESPEAGGPTCFCNLAPKCRFHHNVKTHAEGWLDDQIVDANGDIWTEVTTPEGYTVRSKALNSWLLPELGHISCRHGPAIAPGEPTCGTEPQRPITRLQAKHRYRMAMRAANRRAREAQYEEDGEPPF